MIMETKEKPRANREVVADDGKKGYTHNNQLRR